MTAMCQPERPFAIVVAGVAGSGKTTLGRALAAALEAPLIDLDAVTGPLLDAIPPDALGGHWLTSPHADAIRDGRYAALRSVGSDVIASAGCVVLVAPFTAELRGGEEWARLRDALAPAAARLVRIVGDEALFAQRRAQRGAGRDDHRPESPAPGASGAPALTVDGDLTTAQQTARVLADLGCRRPLDTESALFDRSFDAVLFDLDGTLVDSTASVTRSWRRFAEHYGVSMQALHENHGQPARILISRLLTADLQEEGLARVTELEVDDAEGLVPVRGAAAFFASVPPARRAIVTSGSIPIATARLRSAGFTTPRVFVTVEDVTRGKPDPEPYLTAAARLGVAPSRCLVVEDAPAGIAAARAAGCGVLAVTGTAPAEDLLADLVVDGLDVVEIVEADGMLRLRARPHRAPQDRTASRRDQDPA